MSLILSRLETCVRLPFSTSAHDRATAFSAWQSWAPNAPSTITSIMKLGPTAGSAISMRCIGQSVGSRTKLRNELSALVNVEAPSKPLNIQTLSFLDAINHFSGGLNYESVYMKAKSDYVLSPLSPSAIAAMLAAVAQ